MMRSAADTHRFEVLNNNTINSCFYLFIYLFLSSVPEVLRSPANRPSARWRSQFDKVIDLMVPESNKLSKVRVGADYEATKPTKPLENN